MVWHYIVRNVYNIGKDFSRFRSPNLPKGIVV